jgi:hypothetical protein
MKRNFHITLLLILTVFFVPGKVSAWPWQPTLPVKVMQRNAILAGGKVACFTNTGKKTLSILVTLANSSFKERKSFPVVLAPGETKEIGGFQGWTGVPGESIKLSCDGYSSKSYTFGE